VTSRSLNFPHELIEFLSLYKMWATMDHSRLNIILIFLCLLEVHIGQFRITFGKHAEIHLNGIK
jgi:hypothetical protein